MRLDRLARMPSLLLSGALILATAPIARGEAAPSASTKPNGQATKGESHSTAKAELATIKVDVTLKGIVEAEQTSEVSVRMESWTNPLTVEKAVDHGTVVKKGDVLVELDREKIGQAIEDLRVERSLGELTLKHAEDELPLLERLLPLDMAEAERSKAHADEDLARFLEKDKPLAELGAKFQVKFSANYLEFSRDELAQLEKMYREKDLTEETERLILKRYRAAVESAEFQLKQSENISEQTLKVDLPRREQTYKDGAIKQAVALEKSRSLLPLEIRQKRLARDKLRYDSEKTAERLAKLERDRSAMTVRAPADGIVYYGKPLNGQWTTTSTIAPKLQKGGVIAPDEVFITVVAARPAFVRATVEEKDLHALRPSMEGKAIPTGYPSLKLPARLVSISAIPQTPGNFDARVDVELGRGAEAVMPGMGCAVKLTAYRKENAVTVPSTAVFTDDDDDESHYVYVPAKAGKPQKKTVKVGKASGGKTELLDGLQAGEEILTAKP